MGDDNINPFVAPKLKSHLLYRALHLLFGVLIHTTIIPPGAGKTGNGHTWKMYNTPINMAAAYWWCTLIAEIVIAKDIIEWRVIAVSK